jgi:hypothetical protein
MTFESGIGRARAVSIGLLWLAVFVGGTIVGRRTSLEAVASRADSRDVEAHAAMVDRIRGGEPYYVAVGTVLRQRHYPTLSVFNWRTPFLFSGLARVSNGTARLILVGLTLILLGASVSLLVHHNLSVFLTSVLLQVGAAVAFVVPEAIVTSEAWAGVLVGLSMCAYLKYRNHTGAALGLLALFVRELAAPWVMVCTILAWRARRRSEIYIWILGALAYAIYFGWHFAMVRSVHQPGDFAHQNSWLYGGGLPFIMNTLRMNGLLLVSPRWLSAALLVVIVAAATDRATNVRLRWTIVTYLMGFSIAGQPFNYYWGLVTAALWPLAIPEGVSSIRGVVESVRLRPVRIDPNESTRSTR